GRDDGDIAATSEHRFRVGGDEIVRLEAILLEAGNIECLHRIADEGELRNKLFRQRRPVGLVLGVDLVAEGLLAGVKNHREVGWTARLSRILQELPQHRTEAMHGAHWQSVRGTRQWRQGMERAENVARTVDQIDVATL